MTEAENFNLSEAHRRFAKAANGKVWKLLAKQDRSESEDTEMLLAAHASLYHWIEVGTPVNIQRGYWLLSHVAVILGQPGQAERYAQKCMELTKTDRSSMRDFDVAYAHEGLARAYAHLGKTALAKEHYNEAKAIGEAIKDDEDKGIFIQDLTSGGWPGLEEVVS